MARTDTLGNFLTDVADAIRAKGGTSETIAASDFDTAISNLPTGGSSLERNDVTIYDYDGTIVASYTAADFANLNALPEAPTHEGLTFDKWNWTLTDAKSYVATWGKLNIGAEYHTTDDKLHVHITVPENNSQVYLRLYTGYGSVIDETVDWGDGSAIEPLGSIANSFSTTGHVYTTAGDYIIRVNNPDGRFHFSGNGSQYKTDFLRNDAGGTSFEIKTTAPLAWITSIEFDTHTTGGANYYSFSGMSNLKSMALNSHSKVTIQRYNFSYCYNLRYLTIPDGVTTITSYCFYKSGLQHVSFPNSVYVIYEYAFQECIDLKEIFLSPTSHTSGTLGNNAFYNCNQLEEAIIALLPYTKTLTGFANCYCLSRAKIADFVTLNNNAFNYAMFLTKIKIPSTVTTINNVFANCYSLKEIDCRDHTSVPTLSAVSNLNNIDKNYRVIVPDSLYSTWISTGNWADSSVSSHIVKASEA